MITIFKLYIIAMIYESRDTAIMSEMENTSINKRVWGPWATAGFGIIVIVISFVIQGLVAVIFALSQVFPLLNPSVRTPRFEEVMSAVGRILISYMGLIAILAICVSAVICVGLILAIVQVRRSATIAEYLGFRQITGKTILVSLAITAGFIPLSNSLNMLIERPVPEFLVDTYNTSVYPALLWIALIIFAPVFEEIFFRGFLFEGFRQSRIGITGAISLTALFWALLHFQYGIYEIATIFFLGIVLGIVRLKTDSLWSPLIMHAFANLIAMLELVLYLDGLIG